MSYDDDDDLDVPTFMGWARYRFGVIRAWFASLFRRKRPDPEPRRGTLDLTSFDKMFKEHYRAPSLNEIADRGSPTWAEIRRRWAPPSDATSERKDGES